MVGTILGVETPLDNLFNNLNNEGVNMGLITLDEFVSILESHSDDLNDGIITRDDIEESIGEWVVPF